MELLYTGAIKQDSEQLDSNISLGGFVSNSVIPNDTLSNIFSQASILSVQNNRRETKMIAVKNNNLDIVTELLFKFSIENDSICKYKIAFVKPTIVGNDSCFEQIANVNALPYYAKFLPIENNSTFEIESLSKDTYLGIWLVREYDQTVDSLKKKKCSDWMSILDAAGGDVENIPTPNKVENFSFSIDFTIGEPSISDSSSSSNSSSIITISI